MQTSQVFALIASSRPTRQQRQHHDANLGVVGRPAGTPRGARVSRLASMTGPALRCISALPHDARDPKLQPLRRGRDRMQATNAWSHIADFAQLFSVAADRDTNDDTNDT